MAVREQESTDEIEELPNHSDTTICLPLHGKTEISVTYQQIPHMIDRMQYAANCICERRDKELKAVAVGALESLSMLQEMITLSPGRSVLKTVANNVAHRLWDFLECINSRFQKCADQVGQCPAQLLNPNNWPAILGVPTRNSDCDTNMVQQTPVGEHQRNSVEPVQHQPSTQPPSQPPNQPPNQPPSQPPNQPPTLPPQSSTLDHMLTATNKVLDYVWAYKWWILAGVVGATAGAVALTCAPPIAASIAVGMVPGQTLAAGASAVAVGNTAVAGATVMGLGNTAAAGMTAFATGNAVAAGVAAVGVGNTAVAGAAAIGIGKAAAAGATAIGVGNATVITGVLAGVGKTVTGAVLGGAAGLATKAVVDKYTKKKPESSEKQDDASEN